MVSLHLVDEVQATQPDRRVFRLGIEADDAYLALAGARIKDEGYSTSLAKTAPQMN